jgi:lipid-A-disaccharide synthase
MLPLMCSVTKHFSDYEFIVAAAPSQDISYYENLIGTSPIKILTGKTQDILRNAQAALVTSGTATLETALFGVPEVVCYKANPISYHIARQLVKVDFISLVNLIMGRQIVKELIQADLSEKNLRFELTRILNANESQRIKDDYSLLKSKLGNPGASARAAKEITDFLK